MSNKPTKKTYSVKIENDRMKRHLDSQNNTSGYIRSVIEQDMMTYADEIRHELEELEAERDELSDRLDEIEDMEAELQERLDAAEEVEEDVSQSITEYIAELITIEPDMRPKKIRNTVRQSVPEASPSEVIDVVDDIDLHFVNTNGRIMGDSFKDDVADRDVDFESTMGGIKVTDEDSEAWDVAHSLTDRERNELEEALPQYV